MMVFTRFEFDCVVEVSLDLPAKEKGSFNSTLKPRAKVVFRLTVLNIVCDSPFPNSFNLYKLITIFSYSQTACETDVLRLNKAMCHLIYTFLFMGCTLYPLAVGSLNHMSVGQRFLELSPLRNTSQFLKFSSIL